MRRLEELGFLRNGLFHVSGSLVGHYNRALQAAIGKETKLESFRIDKRGESPEIGEELGWNYLQRGPSDRYLIVVSPLQRSAPLIHVEFSFDDELLDMLYERHHAALELVTRVDGLWGELNDSLRVLHRLDDLVALNRVDVDLDTPSAFLSMARTLQENIERLRAEPDLLIEDDSALLKEIHELAGEVGDVRNYSLDDLGAELEIASFHTRLFDGVHIYREVESPIRPHRPSTHGRADYGRKTAWRSTRRSDRRNRREREKRWDEYKTRRRDEDDSDDDHRIEERPEFPAPAESGPIRIKQVVIFDATRHEAPTSGPDVWGLPLQDTTGVVEFLLDGKFAEFDVSLLAKRLTQIEDRHLAQRGFRLVGSSDRDRRQALADHHDDLPEEWGQLMEIQRKLDAGRSFDSVAAAAPIELKVMLLSALDHENGPRELTANLLTRLWPYDYARMLEVNPQDLENAYRTCDEWEREACLYSLQSARAAGPQK